MGPITTSLLLASSVAAATVNLPSKQLDVRQAAGTSYLAKIADTWVSRGVTKDYGYVNNVLYSGFESAIVATGNADHVAFYEDQMSIVQADGTIVLDKENFDYTFYSLVRTILFTPGPFPSIDCCHQARTMGSSKTHAHSPTTSPNT